MEEIVLPTIEEVIKTLPGPTLEATVSLILDAHAYAAEFHQDRRRRSGELYIEHDRAVARSVNEIGIDTGSTAAGLLHDSIQEPLLEASKSRKKIESRFGGDVIHLVEGLNRLTPYSSVDGTETADKLEKQRRAILHAVEEDIRILLIRLGDNLQDLLMARNLPAEQQLSVAREANEIYAPIANRLGIWSMKWRLEDESFRYLQPEIYKELMALIDEQRLQLESKVSERMEELRRKLAAAGIDGEVLGRSKHIYSIYRKMQRKGVPFDEIYDLRAMRVILNTTDLTQCYQVLGIVHNMWLPIPEEFDDYIANPKPNGYRSLHTAVYDQSGDILEIQIRTRAMDEEAERGIAAHWAYKEGGRPSSELTRRVAWLRRLLIDIRDEEPAETPADQRMINIDDLSKRIYVFTPKRDIIELPEGATPIDFAYQIHTEVGHRCRGAKVNGKMVPLNYELRPGDTVSIITAKRGGPSRDWMSENAGYTRSSKTRSKVRQWFRVLDREDNIYRGLDLIERELKRLKLADQITVEEMAKFFKENDIEDFLAKVGFGDIQYSQVTGAMALLKEKHQGERTEGDVAPESRPGRKSATKPLASGKGLVIQGMSDLHFRIANCCLPIPPEPIVGYVTRGRGVTVHRAGCPEFVKKITGEPERMIEVSWGKSLESEGHEIPLIATAYRRPELAEDVATLVSGRKIKLLKTKSQTDSRGITTLNLLVHVTRIDDLDWLMTKLQAMSNVLEVRRQRWLS